MWCGPDYGFSVSANNRLLSDTESSRVMRSGRVVGLRRRILAVVRLCLEHGQAEYHLHPFDFEEDGGEVVFNLPNGFQPTTSAMRRVDDWISLLRNRERRQSRVRGRVHRERTLMHEVPLRGDARCNGCDFTTVDNYQQAGVIAAIYDPVLFEEKIEFDRVYSQPWRAWCSCCARSSG